MIADRVRLACFAVVLLILSALPASASAVRIVRLSIAQGDVQVDRNSGDGWEQAIVNMPVIGGTRLYAAENSRAELEFEDGSSVRLAGPAQISLIDLSSAPNGSPVNAIQVDSGTVYVNARLRDHEDFRVSDYSGGSFAITKPSHLRFTVNEQTASVAVSDGEAVPQNANPNSTIRSGETYNYVLGQPASAARQNTVPARPEDSWDQQRDSYNNQNAVAGVQYSGADDANAPGVADLGNYGNYSDVPGCGECWQPNGTDQDWDPFGYGAWSYYPAWGWTYVSGYPWGWAPFYYGNWFYAGRRGWWWHPGPFHGPGFGWHPQPLLAGTPHGFSAPHPPGGSAHNTVAVAGSHLAVGPIGVTHASAAANGFAIGGGARASNTVRTNLSQAGATSSTHQVPAALHSGAVSITGRRGSYTVTGPGTVRNGDNFRRAYGSTAPPRSYTQTDYPRVYNVPRPPVEHMPAAPPVSSAPHVSSAPPVSSAPHVSTGGAGSVHSSGGGFSGGAGFSGGGGFHGGGGGGGGHR